MSTKLLQVAAKVSMSGIYKFLTTTFEVLKHLGIATIFATDLLSWDFLYKWR